MKVFLSSTFLDLIDEREAVLKALHKKRASTLAMEYFVATPGTPRETALDNLRKSDVMILVIGFKAGTLLPDGSGSTYTSAEYDELLRLGREPLVLSSRSRVENSTFRRGEMRKKTRTRRRLLKASSDLRARNLPRLTSPRQISSL